MRDYKKLSKSDIPEGYKYAAVNLDGKAYAFKSKPFLVLTAFGKRSMMVKSLSELRVILIGKTGKILL